MFWQYVHDTNGAIIAQASNGLVKALLYKPPNGTSNTNNTNPAGPVIAPNPTLNTTNPTTTPTTPTTTTPTTPTTPTNTTTTPVITPLPANSKISYPIRLAYVDGLLLPLLPA